MRSSNRDVDSEAILATKLSTAVPEGEERCSAVLAVAWTLAAGSKETLALNQQMITSMVAMEAA